MDWNFSGNDECFRLLFENSLDAILLAHPTGRVLAANPAACRMFERTEPEIQAQGRDGLVDAGDPRLQAADGRRFHSGQFHGELTFLRRDGAKFTGEVSTNVFKTSAGLECTSIIIRDVSERERAQKDLQEQQARLNAIIENAGASAWSIDIDRRLTTANTACYESRAEILGHAIHLGDRLPPAWLPVDALAAWNARYARVLSGEAFREEIALQNTVGEIVNREYSFTPIRSGAGEVIGAVCFGWDITERKRSQERIVNLNRLYATISQIDQVIVRAGDREALFQGVCRVAIEHGNYRMAWIGLVDEAAAIVRPVQFYGDEQGYLQAVTIAYLEESEACCPTATAIRENRCVVCENMAADPNPAERRKLALQRGYLSSAAVPIQEADRVIGALTVYAERAYAFGEENEILLNQISGDISYALTALQANARRLQAEESLRASQGKLVELSRRVIETQETERRAIGRELHDQIGQILTALKITLEVSRQMPPEPADKKIRQALELTDDLLQRISRISLDLRLPMLDDLGLIPALIWHVNHYQEQTGIEVVFRHSGVEGKRFASEIETTAYRIIQEAFTNVARHAHATQIRLEVHAREDHLDIHIDDNGQGFDPQTALAMSRGLKGMQERASLVGGQSEIDSAPGSATREFFQLPLQIRTP
ncbi:MAG: PAS domain S-box protein [Chloroflexota bacterium]